MASREELACTYAALILADEGVAVTSDKLCRILEAANVNVESIWTTMFAKAMAGVDIRQMIATSVSSGLGAAAVETAAGTATTTAPATADTTEKTETQTAPVESDSDEDDDGMFGLFDD